jgi:nucleoside-diphosphate-sugar epimerase
MNPFYEKIITERDESCFKTDIENNFNVIRNMVSGSRIALVGAAGSIGSSVVKTILRFAPRALVLIDLSENNLVEVVRDLRASPDVKMPEEFSTLPIAMGSMEFDRYFAENKPFDYFLNLAAIKHVRSEKDIYCLIRMIDTNVLFMHDFLVRNPYKFKKVFSVSSDKAANPANLMGATKMAMEQALLYRSPEQPFSTARFANVAFSDGSLPYGFLRRLEKRQPLSAPNDVKRYFISHQEAGELCTMSAFTGENRDVFFPKFTEGKDEKTFSRIAADLLLSRGYEPFLCATEDEAKRRTEELIRKKQWPCYFFKSDTTGEKDFEEFYVSAETVDFDRFKTIGVIRRSDDVKRAAVEAFLSFAKTAKESRELGKADYVRALENLVPTLRHLETGKNLDGKM